MSQNIVQYTVNSCVSYLLTSGKLLIVLSEEVLSDIFPTQRHIESRR